MHHARNCMGIWKHQTYQIHTDEKEQTRSPHPPHLIKKATPLKIPTKTNKIRGTVRKLTNNTPPPHKDYIIIQVSIILK